MFLQMHIVRRSPVRGLGCALVLGGAATLAGAGAGCEAPARRAAVSPAAMRETYTVNPPGLVFDTPAMQAAKAEATKRQVPGTRGAAAVPRSAAVPGPGAGPGSRAGAGRQAWWRARNDAHLAVRAGHRAAEVTDYVVYRMDRQTIFDDRVHDHHHRVSYSRTTGRVVR